MHLFIQYNAIFTYIAIDKTKSLPKYAVHNMNTTTKFDMVSVSCPSTKRMHAHSKGTKWQTKRMMIESNNRIKCR